MASVVLLNNQGADPDTRLKALRITVSEIPVWELEDSVARPAFTCVNDLLDQAVKLVGEAHDDEGEALLNLTATLLAHSATLVEHIGRQEVCGMGEVPSLPEFLPLILTAAFSCVQVLDYYGSDLYNLEPTLVGSSTKTVPQGCSWPHLWSDKEPSGDISNSGGKDEGSYILLSIFF